MKTLVPAGPMTSFRREMERMFDRMWDFDVPEFPAVGEFRPSLDLSEKGDMLIATVETPGMDPKDLRITVRGDLLTIHGEKKREEEAKDEYFYRTERTYGSFVRTLRLPVAVDGRKVTARFRDGVLTVTLPKAPTTEGATVPIQVE